MNPKKTPVRPGRPRRIALAALALVAVALALPAVADAGVPLPDSPGPPGAPQTPPSHPGEHAQHCFERFVDNSERCKQVWCWPASFLWFDWEECNEAELANCVDHAEITYGCCMKPWECDEEEGEEGGDGEDGGEVTPW